MRTAVFTGSFNPYTIGHDDIVRRALALFDHIVIGVVGDNVHKPDMPPAEERMAPLRKLYAEEPRIEIKKYDGLAVDFAREEGAHFILKGVRSVKDFEYEREMGEINRRLSGIETICFFASPELAHISSTMVRELAHFGKDVQAYLPSRKDD
ncbi:MAG: pantetheine-phosphate adenylyltransferase [Prevotella sp.]|nr:pantetheine-phosphate adenylyltransferase [Prevotella sp.]